MGESREGDVAGDGGVSANDDFVVLAGAGCDEFQNVSAPVSDDASCNCEAEQDSGRSVVWPRTFCSTPANSAWPVRSAPAEIGSRAACAACSWLSVHEMTWIKGTQVRPTSSDR